MVMADDGRYEVSETELTDAEEDFPGYLWGIYCHVMDGELEPEQFVKQQLAIDLIVEFEESDKETRKEIISDILAMYSREDFDIGEDDKVGDEKHGFRRIV